MTEPKFIGGGNPDMGYGTPDGRFQTYWARFSHGFQPYNGAQI
jgi:hypothetical protein